MSADAVSAVPSSINGIPFTGIGFVAQNLYGDYGGYMDAKGGPIQCANCDYQPASIQGALHIGGFLNPRLALMLELQGNGQVVDDRIEGNVTLGQGAALAAVQYWVSPKIWIKGGLGLSHLSYSYNDSYGSAEEPIADGGAVLGAAGIELLQSYNYSVDLQGRLIVGTYDGIDDQITSGSIGVGLNWF